MVTACYSPKKQGCVWSLPVIHLKSKTVWSPPVIHLKSKNVQSLPVIHLKSKDMRSLPVTCWKARMCSHCLLPTKKQGCAVTTCYPINSQLSASGLSTMSKHSDVMSDITSTDHATLSCGNTHMCLGLHYTTSLRFTLPNKFRMSYLSSFPLQSLPGFWSGPLHCLWKGPARQWEISFTLTGLWTHHTSENLIKVVVS